jgi:hypothetical protein
MTKKDDLTRVDERDGFQRLRTAGTDGGFPHACPGTKCAICRWQELKRQGLSLSAVNFMAKVRMK